MKSALFFFLIFFCSANIFAQNDSIFIQAKVSEDKKNISVYQEITYHNKFEEDLHKIKLLNWIAAYKNRKTSLSYRQLEDRKKNLHFAKPEELGNLKNLEVTLGNSSILHLDPSRENLFLPLSKPLKKGEKITLLLHYTLQLPYKT